MRRNRKKFKSWKNNKYHRNLYFFLDPVHSLRSLFSGNNLRIVGKRKIKFTDYKFLNWSTVDLHYIGFWCTDYAPLKVIVKSWLLSATFSQASTFLFSEWLPPKFATFPAFWASTSPGTLHLDAFSDSELAETLKSQSEGVSQTPCPSLCSRKQVLPERVPKEWERERERMPSSVLRFKSVALSFQWVAGHTQFLLLCMEEFSITCHADPRNFALCPKYSSSPKQFPLLWEMLLCQAALPLNQTTFSSCLYLSK